MKIYKLILITILFYLLISIVKENFTQNFTLPKIKADIVKQKQKDSNKFNIEKTIETGQGVHDRIRYEGKWN